MKLEKWALIGEIVASAGVIVSLLFVGLQIRDGNRETRAATVQAHLDSEMTFAGELLRYADIWERVLKGASLETPEEERRAIILYNLWVTLMENRFEQSESGYLELAGAQEIISSNIALPIYEKWRQSPGASGRSPDFLEFLDGRRAQAVVE